MKNLTQYSLLLVAGLLISCAESKYETETTSKEEQQKVLPFTTLNLSSLDAFKPVSSNWKIVGNVNADLDQKRAFLSEPGKGILLNEPDKETKKHLFTAFEHGDIEIEFDVMMPIQSNSGMYFQGRYEVQLFDSWGVKEAKHSDIGGIYQRWDKDREKGQQGFEGRAPKVNAAKAPGLWQHFKVIFHAPKFDASGKKTKNAWFEEVWLNGALLHQNQEVTGPTRACAFNDEKPMGPLMIQGDHGPVAFRNIKYKLYEDKKLTFDGVGLKEYPNKSQLIPDLDTLVAERELKVDSVSSLMVTGQNAQKLLVYKGNLNAPNAGGYLFEMGVHRGGGLLLIEKDTVLNLNGDFDLSKPVFGQVQLKKGPNAFTLIYNKHRPYQRGFTLYAEGPGIARHALHAEGSIEVNNGAQQEIVIGPEQDALIQRSFLMHQGKKRTHTISVGTPQGIHYAYDLAFGSLLMGWSGDFLNVTQMWHARGHQQLAQPLGLPLEVHGKPDFAFLENEKSLWPDSIPEDGTYKQLGFQLDKKGLPTFAMQLLDAQINNKFVASDTLRKLNRTVSTASQKALWHKLGEGKVIEKLPNSTYAIDDKSYYVDFSKNSQYEPVIRKSNGREELIVKIPEGNQEISYQVIW